MFLASRNLLHEPTRLVMTLASMALALSLAVVLSGVVTGVQQQTGDYLAHVPGTIAITAEGAENFLLSSAPLPPGTADRVLADPGVSRVVPILAQTTVLRLHERREATFLIGYDPAQGGAPRRLTTGRLPEGSSEVVLSRLLASRHGIRTGETTEVLGRTLTVSGLVDDLTPLMTSFAFLPKSALEELLLAPGVSTILLVSPAPEVDTGELVDRLGAVAGVDAALKRQVIGNDVRVLTSLYEPPVRIMAAIALVVGTLTIGLLIYAATLEQRREYGVLKAVGSPPRTLYGLATSQALIAVLPGVVLGLVLAWIAARLIMALRPEFLIVITWEAAALAGISGLVMALVAALFPARVIAGLSPADAFRR